MGRLVILSGPSCIGKGPLHAALKKFHPELAARLHQIVLYNDRTPRPAEVDGVDYHFRSREEIDGLRGNDRYVVMEVRGDLQALDLVDLQELVERGDAFFEGNPFVGRELLTCPLPDGVERLSVFLAPLSRQEILYLKAPERKVSLPNFVTDVMRRKLLRRTTKQKTILSLKDLENIERRAGSAYRELRDACRFNCVIPNHDGEDSENWSAFYHPIGDAHKTLHAFVDLLAGRVPDYAEKWDEALIE